MKINMRDSDDKGSNIISASGQQSCNNANGNGPSSPNPNSNMKIRIAVFGQHEVGKSALTVRYLTKRYIGEYKSNTDLLYRQTVTIGQNTIDVEIVDISTSAELNESRRKSFPIEEISRADGFVIVYSITDRSSLTFAQEALETITNHYNHNHHPHHPQQNHSNFSSTSSNSSNSSANSTPTASPQPRPTCPILLVANKLDLEHLRVVEKVEGLSTSMQYGSHFYELSVAENSPEVYTSFQSLISQFVTQSTKVSKRKFSVSKMLGNLRIGRTSPCHHVIMSQASVVDTNVLLSDGESSPEIGQENKLTVPSNANHNNDSNSMSQSQQSQLTSKLVELHSLKKRHNSPPICSL